MDGELTTFILTVLIIRWCWWYNNQYTIDLTEFEEYIPSRLKHKPPKPVTGRAYITRTANVRSGAGTYYSILGQLQPGTELSLREETDKWFHFSSSTLDGWVSKSLTSSSQPNIIVDQSGPVIVITSLKLHQNIYRTTEPIITIRGNATDNEGIGFVTVNGNETQLLADGTFTKRLRLRIGKNEVQIRAMDVNDNAVNKNFVVIREEFTDDSEFSNVDFPRSSKYKNKHGIGVVLGIQEYLYAPSVSYAYNDADIFREYLIKTFGFSRENIYFKVDNRATKGEFEKIFNRDGWLTKNASSQTDVVIFYAGHGAPDLESKQSYLVPYDVDPNYATTGYALNDLYENLGSLNAKSITVIIDACFSGGSRDNQPILADARPIYISIEGTQVPKTVRVFSAASGKEISSGYKSKMHGLFTYYFLKGLNGDADKNGDRRITYSEMQEFVAQNVSAQAKKMGREQHPQFQGEGTNRVLLKY